MVAAARVSALVLAGGRGTRMGGAAKHELVVEGETIFARLVKVLAPRVEEIVVSSAIDVAGFRTVRDRVVDAGPLAGIAAGLAAAATPWVVVVAGDMPHVSGAVVDAMLAKLDDAAVDAVGVRVGGEPQPLLCVLARGAVLAVVEGMLARGSYKASRLLTDEGLRVAWLEEAELRAIDPELRALRNINTPSDLL